MLITHYSIKLRKRNYLKRTKASGYTLHKKMKIFLPFTKNLFNKYGKKLMDTTATKTGLGEA